MKRIAGFGISSMLTLAAAAAEHVSPGLPGEYATLATALATFLTHVLAHFTSGQAEAVLAGFEHSNDNNLQFAFVAAYTLALKKMRARATEEGLSSEDLAFIDKWLELLQGMKAPEDSEWLFVKDDPLDPAGTTTAAIWLDARRVLLRWAEVKTLPPLLDSFLEKNFPREIEFALEFVVQDKLYTNAWLAWQQSFLKATYLEVRESKSELDLLIKQILDSRAIQVHILEKVTEIDLAVRSFSGLHHTNPTPLIQPDVLGYLSDSSNLTRYVEIKNLRTSDGSVNRFDIVDLYTPLSALVNVSEEEQLDRENRWRQEQEQDWDDDLDPRPTDTLQDTLKHARVLIIGDPGAGKTTFLRRIAFEACQRALGLEFSPSAMMLSFSQFFPMYVRADALARHISASDPEAGALADLESPEWLIHYLAAAHRDIGDAFFHDQFREGGLLLIDGLDEIGAEMFRASVATMLSRLGTQYPRLRVVATSRPGAFGGVTNIDGFRVARVAQLDTAAIELFATKWTHAVHPHDVVARTELYETLLGEIRAKAEIQLMARNPVMLTALACLHFTNATLPEQRSELYNSILEWLAKARATKTGRGYHSLLALLRKLAYAMHTGQSERRTTLERDEAIGVLASKFQEESTPARQREAAAQFLTAEEVNSGIVLNFDDTIRFWHPTFQESLVAGELAYDPQEREKQLFEQGKVYSPSWRETVLLLAGELKRLGNRPVNELIRKILDGHGKRGDSFPVDCVDLIGALLRDLAAWRYSLPSDLAEKYRDALKTALIVFEPEGSRKFPFEKRLGVAEALGRAGDPRFDRLASPLLGALAARFVDLKGGAFWIGAQCLDPSSRNYDPEVLDDEMPLSLVQVARFSISRYPVTVAEYALFLKSDGYNVEQTWLQGGADKYKEPRNWVWQLRTPNKPVTGVSWYEASAYCIWKGASLPSDAEWEYAARGGSEWALYPWGNEVADEWRANFQYEGAPRSATPVGMYPSGATPAGVYDMGGNIWEWTTTWYRENHSRCARGGSWQYSSRWLKVAHRYSFDPNARLEDLGFRCISYDKSLVSLIPDCEDELPAGQTKAAAKDVQFASFDGTS